ncbi:MAG: SLC13 family permease [Dehalococcoidales bacterium]|nr:SLC13 family permease [Dehalococcoidales bacterium]
MLAQIFAIVIFLLMFTVIIINKFPRYIPALIGGALTILVVFLMIMKSPATILSVLNFGQIALPAFWISGHEPLESAGVNWQTIIFIGGMMVMVEGLGKVGFFRWLCLYVAKIVKYKAVSILVAFILLSGFMAMFIDSITVLLFFATVTIELARLMKFDPVPVIIAEIFAANVGGSATMAGDPPNIIIGTALGYSFSDFLVNTGVIAWVGMIASLVFFYLVFRKSLKASQTGIKINPEQYPEPKKAISDPKLFITFIVIFLLVIILLITHAETGISVAFIGVIAAGLTLAFGHKDFSHIVKRVDWQTLLFFVGLFICVGGLEQTGALEVLAEFISKISGGNLIVVISIILWVSAFASGIVDNIPFAATMIPVIKGLAATGLPLPALAWTLALGADIGGNATPIGASANVVGTAIAEKEGYPISWGRFCKYALPAMILVVGICWVLLIVRYA